MVNKEEILNFVKFNGPVIPNQIKKQFGGELYLISAILSEFSSKGLIKISHTKIGGSPTYYTPGQEHKLVELKKHLNSKDQATFDLLREKKVLRDKDQEMLIRVSVRAIKDFAKQLEVNIRGEKEVFWKWYMTPMSEAETIIRKLVGSSPKIPDKSDELVEEKNIEKEEAKKEEVNKEEFKEEAKKNTSETNITQEILPQNFESEIANEGFGKQLYDYFASKNIQVIEEEVIRKKSEIEFVVSIPSNVGQVEYFCKAKSKKKCNDGDLSSAYIKGQMKKLPVLFITTGEVTKKAQEMLNKEFKGMVVKTI